MGDEQERVIQDELQGPQYTPKTQTQTKPRNPKPLKSQEPQNPKTPKKTPKTPKTPQNPPKPPKPSKAPKAQNSKTLLLVVKAILSELCQQARAHLVQGFDHCCFWQGFG